MPAKVTAHPPKEQGLRGSLAVECCSVDRPLLIIIITRAVSVEEVVLTASERAKHATHARRNVNKALLDRYPPLFATHQSLLNPPSLSIHTRHTVVGCGRVRS